MPGSGSSRVSLLAVVAVASVLTTSGGCASTGSPGTDTSVAMAAATPGVCPRLPVHLEDKDDRTLTAADRDAYYRAIYDGWQQNYAAWLDSSCVTDLDPREIERKQTEGEYGRLHETTFVKAVDAAQLVVQGTVRSTRFVPFGTLTEFAVDRTAKGEDQRTVSVLQISALHPKPGFKAGYISSEIGQPILLPGDKAVLLLNTDPQTSDLYPELDEDTTYRIRFWSGQYLIKNGKVRKVPGSQVPYVNGVSVDRLMDRAEARARTAPNAPTCRVEMKPCS